MFGQDCNSGEVKRIFVGPPGRPVMTAPRQIGSDSHVTSREPLT